jgi:hypothetical protein
MVPAKPVSKPLVERPSSRSHKGATDMITVLLVVLLLMAIGAFPSWNHSRSWGYFPSGGLGLVVLVLLILLLLGRV